MWNPDSPIMSQMHSAPLGYLLPLPSAEIGDEIFPANPWNTPPQPVEYAEADKENPRLALP